VCVCGINCYSATILAVSPRLVIDAREVHVEFVVDKVALRQVVTPSTWRVSLSIVIPTILHINLSIIRAMDNGPVRGGSCPETEVQRDAKRIRNKTEQAHTMRHRALVVSGRAKPSQMVSPQTRRRLLLTTVHMLSLFGPVNTFRCRMCYLQVHVRVLNLSANHNFRFSPS